MMFAIITPALITGAFAERMKFRPLLLFMLLWSTFVYDPLAHWVWGGGWLATHIGALDFAGGTVVHISAASPPWSTAIYLGKRLGHGHEPMAPHNLPFTVLGAALLWFGWFGFNAGSAGAPTSWPSSPSSPPTWPPRRGPRLALRRMAAGRQANDPGRGLRRRGRTGGHHARRRLRHTGPMFISGLAGVVCYMAVSLKPRLGYDDSLDVVGVHMVGGTLGALLTGVFATTAINSAIPALTLSPGIAGGLLHGGGSLVLKQFIAVAATYAFCGVGTLVLLIIVDSLFKIRALHEEEIPGLDISQHSERAYRIDGGEAVAFFSLEPKPASLPPISWDRFTIELDGVDADLMRDRWRSLCKEDGAAPTAEFKNVYSHVSTIRGNQFKFRGGEPETLRASLENLFRPVAPAARARIESIQQNGSGRRLATV